LHNEGNSINSDGNSSCRQIVMKLIARAGSVNSKKLFNFGHADPHHDLDPGFPVNSYSSQIVPKPSCTEYEVIPWPTHTYNQVVRSYPKHLVPNTNSYPNNVIQEAPIKSSF